MISFKNIEIPKYHIFWLIFRIMIVCYFALPSIQDVWDDKIPTEFTIETNQLIIFVAFFIIGGFLQMSWALHRLKKNKIKNNQEPVFYKPSWRLNPFMKNEGYQFMHMASIAFLISGISGLLRFYYFTPENSYPNMLMPYFLIIVSVSWLVGIYGNIYFFNRSKFIEYKTE